MLTKLAAKAGAATAVAATAGALLLGAAAPASAATPASDAGTQAICGYYSSGGKGYYNHCGPTNITIHVEYTVGSDNLCVTPGVTSLGYFAENAWYTGLC
ncbi:DUF6355 family natural product biosynthesis protein [Amycolatopsis sp. CA-126428]|uniref:DUF6355 family natural product biosynthesis protein n=1 Tax=Amycolatopsis sp. CA-126428 TaxID=2073158 RepID=UPI000CD27D0E|nr:DUF6355 family natural product biosynthesis protein [Amycolatopsis sp. CA-126428]